jgi:DNA modification methylase
VIDLRCSDVGALMDSLPDGSVDLVIADPPWSYRNDTIRGGAWLQYDTLPIEDIVSHVRAAWRVAADDAYCLVWCTFPLLHDWAKMGQFTLQWEYLTGGAWIKTGAIGVGIHLRGNAEVILVYRKGAPKPRTHQMNYWLAPRGGHSEKPQKALRDLVRWGAPECGLVLDLYAGASGALARACRAEGRRYMGAEIDPARHAEALRRISLAEQSALALEELAS